MGLRSKIKKVLLPYSLAFKQEGGAFFKLKYLHYAKLAQRRGVIDFRIDRVAGEYTHDWFNVKDVSQEDKEWFCQRGIAPYKLHWYGITKENYKDYLSDFVFYNSNNYMDKRFMDLFEHKLNTYIMLAPFVKNQPIHYYYKRNGQYLPIGGGSKNGTLEDVLHLIQRESVAAKSCLGGHGKGFYKFHYDQGQYFLNNQLCSEGEIAKKLDELDDYILTEYVKPHHVFSEICGDGAFPPAIRCITVYDGNDGAQLTTAIIRLGSKEGGLVTDYHGTIYCGIEIETGRLFKPIWRENDTTFKHIVKHPDTHVELDGIIVPNWEKLKTLIVSISSYLPWTPYLVTDIIPTEDGFKVLEINSHGQARNCEAHYPFCLNKYQRKVFNIL